MKCRRSRRLVARPRTLACRLRYAQSCEESSSSSSSGLVVRFGLLLLWVLWLLCLVVASLGSSLGWVLVVVLGGFCSDDGALCGCRLSCPVLAVSFLSLSVSLSVSLSLCLSLCLSLSPSLLLSLSLGLRADRAGIRGRMPGGSTGKRGRATASSSIAPPQRHTKG